MRHAKKKLLWPTASMVRSSRKNHVHVYSYILATAEGFLQKGANVLVKAAHSYYAEKRGEVYEGRTYGGV